MPTEGDKMVIAARIIAESVMAFSQIAGAIAANTERESHGHALAYDDGMFEEIRGALEGWVNELRSQLG